jgi:hypothetical protein
MALMSRVGNSARENMGYLADLMDEHDVDVAILNEAPVGAPPRDERGSRR